MCGTLCDYPTCPFWALNATIAKEYSSSEWKAVAVLTFWLKSTVMFLGSSLGVTLLSVKGTGTFAFDTSSGVRDFETNFLIMTIGVNVPSGPLRIGTAMTR